MVMSFCGGRYLAPGYQGEGANIISLGDQDIVCLLDNLRSNRSWFHRYSLQAVRVTQDGVAADAVIIGLTDTILEWLFVVTTARLESFKFLIT